MTSLGSTVGRLMGRGPVIAPPRPRFSPPDVIVVPEPEPEEPRGTRLATTAAPRPRPANHPHRKRRPRTWWRRPRSRGARRRTRADAAGPSDRRAGTAIERADAAGRPGGSLMDLHRPRSDDRPDDRPAAARSGDRRSRSWPACSRSPWWRRSSTRARCPRRSWPAASGTTGCPGTGGTDITTDQPGTYEGIVHVRADGSIHLRASGDIQLRIDGLSHIVAIGDVKVSGDGVVNNVSSAKVRVRGNGTIRITVKHGSIRLRLQGTVTAQSEGSSASAAKDDS